MSSTPTETTSTNDPNLSVGERFVQAVSLIDSAPTDALVQLQELQKQVAALSLFSSNEGVDEISTKSLPLLALEFHLALAHLACPTTTQKDRKTHVLASIDLFSSYLQRLEELELLSKANTKDFHDLLEMTSDEGEAPSQQARTQGQQREAKIARFRAQQELKKQVDRLKSLQERRGRLDIAQNDEMDGYDEDSLERQVTLSSIQLNAAQAIDEWFQAQRELPMIEMGIQMEERRKAEDRHLGVSSREEEENLRKQQQALSGKPLQLTHITQDSVTGQLNIKKEEIRSKVFRPGWNQPTMTLQELGELERKQAIEREERQRIAEAEQKKAPRRYDQLVKDGLEDNADLVDASAELDRKWDDFKDENPRGCGNKMGDRGDRNF